MESVKTTLCYFCYALKHCRDQRCVVEIVTINRYVDSAGYFRLQIIYLHIKFLIACKNHKTILERLLIRMPCRLSLFKTYWRQKNKNIIILKYKNMKFVSTPRSSSAQLYYHLVVYYCLLVSTVVKMSS